MIPGSCFGQVMPQAERLIQTYDIAKEAVVLGGLSRHAAARRFGVSIASAVRWVTLHKITGQISPSPSGGDRRSGRIEAPCDYLLGPPTPEPEPGAEGRPDRRAEADVDEQDAKPSLRRAKRPRFQTVSRAPPGGLR